MPGGRDLSVSSCATVLSTSSSHLPLLFKRLLSKSYLNGLCLYSFLNGPSITVTWQCLAVGKNADGLEMGQHQAVSPFLLFPQQPYLSGCHLVSALHLLVILLLFKLSKHFFQSSWKFSWPFKDDSKSSMFAFWSALVKWLRLHMKLGLGLSSGWELLTSWLVCVSWIIWHFPAFLLSARLALQEWTGSSGLWRSTRWGCQGRAGCGTSAVLLGGMPWWERFFQLYCCGVHWKCPGFP